MQCHHKIHDKHVGSRQHDNPKFISIDKLTTEKLLSNTTGHKFNDNTSKRKVFFLSIDRQSMA